MSKRYLVVLIAISMLATTFSALAQFKANTLGGGAAIGTTIGDTDFGRDDEGATNFRAFLRHSLADKLEAEVGAGIASGLNGEDYETQMLPIDFRLLYRPFELTGLSPYVFAGAGAIRYDVRDVPATATADAELDGWMGYAPLGAGVQIRLNDYTSFEIQGTYGLAFDDELEGVVADGNDKFYSLTAGLTMAGFDGNADPDMDGLTNSEEKKLGTDPQVADTDGDGLLDGEEFNTYKTDPLNPDSDSDGLSDSEEVKTHKTNPNSADSDDDTLGDKDEVMTHGTDPNKADTDGDGLSDPDELNTHTTDPKMADMDKDGLNDGKEVNDTKTDPKNADTDGDGLNDGDEVMTHKSDPMNVDTDAGSVNDGAEVARGTNPLVASDDVIIEVKEVGAPIILDGVVFATGKADITDASAEILEKAYNTMLAYPELEVEIHGYTDSQGGARSNQRLSKRRADSVRAWLLQKGVDPARVAAKGFGEDNPIADNATAEGRQANRRIEFVRSK
ncbi:MAG: OmpA family protein [Calditrichia bacterium]